MAAPAIQISYNDAEIMIFWDMDTTGTYMAYKLYWSADSGMAGETTISQSIPNSPDTNFSKISISYKFKREQIGLNTESTFYLRLKGILMNGSEDTANPGPIRRIAPLSEKVSHYSSGQAMGYDRSTNTWRKLRVSSDGALS